MCSRPAGYVFLDVSDDLIVVHGHITLCRIQIQMAEQLGGDVHREAATDAVSGSPATEDRVSRAATRADSNIGTVRLRVTTHDSGPDATAYVYQLTLLLAIQAATCNGVGGCPAIVVWSGETVRR
jgi:hypothetical protein